MEESTLNVLRLIMDSVSESSVYSVKNNLKVFPMSMLNACRSGFRDEVDLKNSEDFERSKPYFNIEEGIIYSLTEEDRDKFIIKNSKDIILAYNEYEKGLNSKCSHELKSMIISSYIIYTNYEELEKCLNSYQIVEGARTIERITETFYRTEIVDMFKKFIELKTKVLNVDEKLFLLQKI